MTGFVKLDADILRSSLWVGRDLRSLFITALVMAEPHELTEPAPAINIRSLEPTGFSVPPGWYGFVKAAGVGIIRQDGVDLETGYLMLEQLSAPDPDSRNPKNEGRRMVRIDGGFILLNYFDYRDKDYGAAERMRRMRARRNGVDVTANGYAATRNDTQADSREHMHMHKQRTTTKTTDTAPKATTVSGGKNGGNGNGSARSPDGVVSERSKAERNKSTGAKRLSPDDLPDVARRRGHGDGTPTY